MAPMTAPPVHHDAKVQPPGRHGYIAQWLERLTADQQVPGSNPGVPFYVCWYCGMRCREMNILTA
jgi:hypothetical protein